MRLASSSDFPELFRISSAAHRNNYTNLIAPERRNDFYERYALTQDNAQLYIDKLEQEAQQQIVRITVATDLNGLLAGFIIVKEISDNSVEIDSLFVDPEFQGQGIGAALFERVVDQYSGKQITLDVIHNNKPAIKLYKRYGFKAQKGESDNSFFGAPLVTMQKAPNGAEQK